MTYYKGLKIQDKRSLVVAISTALLLIATVVAAWHILAPQKSVRADAINTTDFVTTWKTDNQGNSNDSSVYLSFADGSNYEVDWNNDGVYDQTVASGSVGHDYGTPGTYTIRVKGNFGRLYFNNHNNSDPKKLIEVKQWGISPWVSMDEAFKYTQDLQFTATDTPNLQNVSSMSSTFEYAEGFNSPIGNWDVSSVAYMGWLFYNAKDFNQPLDDWDVSSVTDMSVMFGSAEAFNQSLSSWDVSNVTNMFGMFSVFTMAGEVSSFNQPIGNWDVSSVVDMSDMFKGASKFNQPIGNWYVSNVTNMTGMFYGALRFNQPLNSWDVSSVTSMAQMFVSAGDFNQDISSWDTSSVQVINEMFLWARSFNRSLGDWNVSSLLSASNALRDSGMSVASYDSTLEGWAIQPLQQGVVFNNESLRYCEAFAARQYIIDTFNWQFQGYYNYDIDDSDCGEVTIDGRSEGVTVTEESIKDGGIFGVVGVDGVDGFIPTSYVVGCRNLAASHDDLFSIQDGQLILTDSSTNQPYYEVCIRAQDDVGRAAETSLTITVIDSRVPTITEVSFSNDNGIKVMIIAGDPILRDESEIQQALYRSMVQLNGVNLPFCASGFGVTASELVDAYSMSDPSLVSDGRPCYRLLDATNYTYLLTPTQAQIELSDDFDITAPGTVSVNNSPVFAFNQPTGGGGDDGGNGGDDNSGGSTGGSEDGGDNGNGPTYQETITVNGTKPIANQPVIPKKPTFTGRSCACESWLLWDNYARCASGCDCTFRPCHLYDYRRRERRLVLYIAVRSRAGSAYGDRGDYESRWLDSEPRSLYSERLWWRIYGRSNR